MREVMCWRKPGFSNIAESWAGGIIGLFLVQTIKKSGWELKKGKVTQASLPFLPFPPVPPIRRDHPVLGYPYLFPVRLDLVEKITES